MGSKRGETGDREEIIGPRGSAKNLKSGIHTIWKQKSKKEESPASEIRLHEKARRESRMRYSNILDIIAANDIDVPGERLRHVVPEVLEAYPDESICFFNVGNLQRKARIIKEHFIPDDPRRAIAYAIKANARGIVLSTLIKEGITHFDCASPGEVAHVQHHALAGDEATILYNNPIKLPQDIADAAIMGVRHFTAQTSEHVETIVRSTIESAKEGNIQIAARLKTNNENADINLSSAKFGASAHEVVRMINMIRRMISSTPGISIHAGSQNRDVKSFERAIKFMADVAESAGGVETVNVGGGIPVNYFEHDHYSLVEYLKHISKAVNEHVKRALNHKVDESGMIAIELGRAIIADSADLYIPIMAIQDGPLPAIHINDGVFTSFIDYPLHGWEYNLKAVRADGSPRNGKKKLYKVYGRSCDSGDHVGAVKLAEDMSPGDYIWVENAGAYLDSVSTVFNGFLPPRYALYNQQYI